MSKIVNVSTMNDMYTSFQEIYPEFKAMCNGFRMFNWDDRIRKILINLNNIDVKILFSVRKGGEEDVWSEFSALLIPAPEKEDKPDPDKNAEVEISEDL